MRPALSAASRDASVPFAESASLMRQPVLDAARAVHAYELIDRSPSLAAVRELLRQRDAQAAGAGALFLPADAALLESEELATAYPKGLVLNVAPAPGDDPAAIEALQPTLAALYKRGVRLALPRSALKKAYAAWLPLAAYVKLPTAAITPAQLPLLLKFIGDHTPAQAIACDVGSIDQFQSLLHAGVPYFQGDWFARPSPVPRGSMPPSQALVIQLMNMLQRHAELPELEGVIKRDPSLSFHLLRVINAANMALSCEVTSLRHALMMMGQKRLFRWTAALMVTARAAGTAPAVAEAAMVRARLMELLAAELLPPDDCDNAFVAGVFSLLGVMLDMPLHAVLDGIAVPEAVSDALLHQRGLLAPFLALTIACESGDDTAFAEAADALHLDSHRINWSHLQALAWAQELAASW